MASDLRQMTDALLPTQKCCYCNYFLFLLNCQCFSLWWISTWPAILVCLPIQGEKYPTFDFITHPTTIPFCYSKIPKLLISTLSTSSPPVLFLNCCKWALSIPLHWNIYCWDCQWLPLCQTSSQASFLILNDILAAFVLVDHSLPEKLSLHDVWDFSFSWFFFNLLVAFPGSFSWLLNIAGPSRRVSLFFISLMSHSFPRWAPPGSRSQISFIHSKLPPWALHSYTQSLLSSRLLCYIDILNSIVQKELFSPYHSHNAFPGFPI